MLGTPPKTPLWPPSLKTYELASIPVLAGGSTGAKSLRLRDGGGRQVDIELGVLEADRRLWNLVCNGMARSVAHRDAELNGLAADQVLHLEQYRRSTSR